MDTIRDVTLFTACLHHGYCRFILPDVITSISTDIYIIAYELVSILNIQHSHLHDQPLTMLCTAACFVP